MSSNSEVKVHCSVPELVLSEVKEELPDIKHEVKIEDETVLPELIKTEITNEEYDHFKKKEEIRVKKGECLVKKEEYDLVIKKEEHDLDDLKCFTCPSCSTQFVNEEPFLDHILHQHHVNAASSEQRDELPNQTINLVNNFPGTENFAFAREASHISLEMINKVDHQVSNSTRELKLASGEVDEDESNTSLSPQDVTTTTSSEYPGKRRSHLRKHDHLVHNDEGERPFQCSKCSYSAKRKHHLKLHQQAHSSERPFQCSECPYSAKIASALRLHKVIHDKLPKLKPFQCSEYSYTTANKSHLKQHQRTHSSERLFHCLICPYRNRKRSNLRKHELIHVNNLTHLHSDERLFKCCEFSYTTALRSSLKLHQRTHSGERPFQCTECSYSAKRKSYLERHYQFIHSSV